MAVFWRYIIGLAASNSTPSAPVLDSTDHYHFTINPESLDGMWQGGVISQVISGAPVVSTTQIPKDTITVRWPKLAASIKRAILDYYLLLGQKLILIDDQRYIMEVVVVPGSYNYARRRSTVNEVETYGCQVQLIILGIKRQMTISEREAL